MKCAVCSAVSSHTIEFSKLTSRQQQCCLLLRTQETEEKAEHTRKVVCQACFTRVQTFLGTGSTVEPDCSGDTETKDLKQQQERSSQCGSQDSANEDSPEPTTDSTPKARSRMSDYLIPIATAAVGGAVSIVAAPVVVGALGFGTAGIAAGSAAAGMMSSAWTTGIGVGVVSTLQSVGAAGMGAAGVAAAGATGGGIGGVIGGVVSRFR